MTNVDEVCISRDVLEIVSAGNCLRFSLVSFGKGREIGTGLIPIGELRFSKSSYPDSHFVFYATPRIAIFMPSGDATGYPDSHFWRIIELLRGGGFKFYEGGPPTRTPIVLAPRPIRTFAYILGIIVVAWVYALGGFLPESTGGSWRRFLLSNPHNPSVGLAFILPAIAVPILLAFRHGRSLQTLIAIILASYAISLVSEWAIRRAIHSWAALELPPFNIPFGTAHHLVSVLLFVTASALIGWSWRRGFLEPMPRGREIHSTTGR